MRRLLSTFVARMMPCPARRYPPPAAVGIVSAPLSGTQPGSLTGRYGRRRLHGSDRLIAQGFICIDSVPLLSLRRSRRFLKVSSSRVWQLVMGLRLRPSRHGSRHIFPLPRVETEWPVRRRTLGRGRSCSSNWHLWDRRERGCQGDWCRTWFTFGHGCGGLGRCGGRRPNNRRAIVIWLMGTSVESAAAQASGSPLLRAGVEAGVEDGA